MSRHVGRTTRRIGLLVCAALVVTSPAAHGQLLGPLSEEAEVELGRLAAAEIEKGLTLLTDDAVTSYVSELGQALAARSGRSHLTYQFKVVDAAEINAFALPGGFICVHRGLIEVAEKDTKPWRGGSGRPLPCIVRRQDDGGPVSKEVQNADAGCGPEHQQARPVRADVVRRQVTVRVGHHQPVE